MENISCLREGFISGQQVRRRPTEEMLIQSLLKHLQAAGAPGQNTPLPVAGRTVTEKTNDPEVREEARARLAALTKSSGSDSGIFEGGDLLITLICEQVEKAQVEVLHQKRVDRNRRRHQLHLIKVIRLGMISVYADLWSLGDDPSSEFVQAYKASTEEHVRSVQSHAGKLPSRLEAVEKLKELLNTLSLCLRADPALLFMAHGESGDGIAHVKLTRRYLGCVLKMHEEKVWEDAEAIDEHCKQLLKSIDSKSEELGKSYKRLDDFLKVLLEHYTHDRRITKWTLEAIEDSEIRPSQELREGISADFLRGLESCSTPQATLAKKFWKGWDCLLFHWAEKVGQYSSMCGTLRSVDLDSISASDLRAAADGISKRTKEAKRWLNKLSTGEITEQLLLAHSKLEIASKKLRRGAGDGSVRELADCVHTLISDLTSVWLILAPMRHSQMQNHCEDEKQLIARLHAIGILRYTLAAAQCDLKMDRHKTSETRTLKAEAAEVTHRAGGGNGGRGRTRRRKRRSKTKQPIKAKVNRSRGILKAPSVDSEPPMVEPVEKEAVHVEVSQNFLQELSGKEADSQPHPKSYALASRGLRHLGLVIADIQAEVRGKNPPKALYFQQIDYAQRLLERTLVRTLSMVDAQKGELHVLDARLGGLRRPLKEQHSLRILAAALTRAAPGGEVSEVIAQYADLINTLDLAHSYLFYPERCALNHPQRGSGPAKRILKLLKGIESGDQSQISLSAEILPSALACSYKLIKVSEGLALESVDLSRDAELERLLGKVGDAPVSEEAKELPEAIDGQEWRMPPVRSSKDAIDRIRQCRSLIECLTRVPADGAREAQDRRRLRNASLAHVDRFLAHIQQQARATNCPFTAVIPSVDRAHRALKEAIVAALYHHSLYGETGHRIHEAKIARGWPLLSDNNVCETLRVLKDALGSDTPSGLPEDLYKELSWLAVIHDHLAYPMRKRESRNGEVLTALGRLTENRRLLERFSGLDEGWRISRKSGRGEVSRDDVIGLLEKDSKVLMEEGVYPCLNSLYMILHAGFTVRAPNA